ncbi:hypothetical protein HMPREF0539_1943, partial [Lacticaseibacillus rhamnosus LMS2-1]
PARAQGPAGIQHGAAALPHRRVQRGMADRQKADGIDIDEGGHGAGEDQPRPPVEQGHGHAVEPEIGLAQRLQQAQGEH